MWLLQSVFQAEGVPRRVLVSELEVSDPKWIVKYGLNVGADVARIREVLGAPQKTDASTWRYEDANGNAVIFTIAVDRIAKVRWAWATSVEAAPNP
jgi:hypothetical protein